MEKDKEEVKPFVVKLEKLGAEGDPMVKLNGIPAYLRRTRTLRPQVGEEWFVTVKYQDERVIILHPVRQFIPSQ